LEALPISIFPIDSKPYGLTYGEWSAKWWQWAVNNPKSSSPMIDSTGANAKNSQNSPYVFFLCQTYEGVNSIPDRTIEIPRGRSIFMPIINWISILHNDGECEEELLTTAKKRMDVVANLEISVNQISIKKGLEKYRAQSPFFEFDLYEDDNILGLPAGQKRAVSDGYWLFIEQLKYGAKLTTFGSCSSGATRIGVNYNISFV
jgi:hypothetical protein